MGQPDARWNEAHRGLVCQLRRLVLSSAGLPPTLLLVAAIGMVFVAGVLRGFTGFGFSLSAVPLLSLVMPPSQAVPIALILQFVVSLGGLRTATTLCDWRSVRWLALGAVIATPVGVWALMLLPPAPVRMVIAVLVASAVVVIARGVRMNLSSSPAPVIGFGLLSGIFNGLTGIPGPPVVAYYLAAPIETSVARASMIVFFLATSIFGLLPLISLNMLSRPILIEAFLAFPGVVFGSWLGASMYHRSRAQHYRAVALSLLVLTAVLAAARSMADLI